MLEKALNIDGWMTTSELAFLQAIAISLTKNARAVEVGSWKGRSTVAICEAVKERSDIALYAVDTFQGDSQILADGYGAELADDGVFTEFRRNTEAYPFLQTIRADSRQAVEQFEDGTLDWVFLDADHAYDAVRADITVWYPKLKPNGLLTGHDYGNVSVTRAVRTKFPHVCVWDKIWYIRRTQSRVRERMLPRAEAIVRRSLLKQRF